MGTYVVTAALLLLFIVAFFLFILLRFTRTIREAEGVKRDLELSKRRYYNVFNHSEVSLTVEDVGSIRSELLDIFPRGALEEEVTEYLYRNMGTVKRLVSLIQILDVNERTLELFHAPSKAQMIASYAATFTEKSYGAFIGLAAALAAGKTGVKEETELCTLTGEKLNVLMKVSLPRMGDDTTAIVSIVDVTSEKNLQREIMAERDRAQQYLDIVDVIIVVYDTAGTIQRINRKGCRLFGYTEEELLGKNWFDTFVLPENREWLKEKFKNIMKGRIPYNPVYNEDLLKKNGDTVHVDWQAVPLRDSRGQLRANLCSGMDVSLLMRKQRQLEKSEQRFKAVEKLAKIGYWEADIVHGKYFWSDENYRILGFTPKEVEPSSRTYISLIHPDDREQVTEGFDRSVQEHRDYQATYRLAVGNEVKYVADWTQHFYDERGVHIYSAGLSQDITRQVLTEQKLEKSLREREALLRELHHRTKNNMQVISAMLNLRAGVENDAHISGIFSDMDSKIQSMARAHEKLYKSGDLSHINFSEYFIDLLELLKESYDTERRGISFIVEGADLEVLIDIAIPCGLILNELVTNAIKYAFPEGGKGVIEVTLKDEGAGNISFTVTDNGVGLAAGIRLEELDSLGMRTIMALGEDQLQGSVLWETDGGVSCTVRFRNDTYSERI